MSRKNLSLVAFIVSLVALVVSVFLVVLSTRTTDEPVLNNQPPVTPPGSTNEELPPASFKILSIEPASESTVVMPFEITVITDKPTASGISSADCESTRPGQGVHFQALLALDLIPKQTVNKIPVNEQTLGAGDLISCSFTITIGVQSGDITSQQIEYIFGSQN